MTGQGGMAVAMEMKELPAIQSLQGLDHCVRTQHRDDAAFVGMCRKRRLVRGVPHPPCPEEVARARHPQANAISSVNRTIDSSDSAHEKRREEVIGNGNPLTALVAVNLCALVQHV